MQKKMYRNTLLLLLFLFASTVYAQAQITVTLATTPACSLDGSITATVTGGTAPYTYTWYGPNGPIGTNTSALTGVAGGQYYVQVVDQNQQYGYNQDIVTPPFIFNVTATPELCGDGTGTGTATITSGGAAPFSYLWTNGMTTPVITGLHQGNYELTITDATGCFVSSVHDSLFGGTVAVVQDSSPMSFGINSTISVCTDGTASVVNITNGTAPYSYLWSTTPPQFTATATNLLGWSYGQVTVTDAAGCTGINYYSIQQAPNGLSLQNSQTDETCLQGNGSASVTVLGGTAPFTYIWSNGATTPSVSGLSYGYYTVTVTDNNACPKIGQFYIQRTDPMGLSMTRANPGCNNLGGSMAVSVFGGAAPYTYLWSNGATTSSLSNLGVGYYSVTVTDANGCYDHIWSDLYLPPNCFGTISGYSLGDLNNNCIHDGSDIPLPNRIIEIGTLNYGITDWNGYYTEQVLPGSYTVAQPTPPNYYTQACPSAPNTYTVSNITPGQSVTNLDFFNTTTSTVQDLSIAVYAEPARPTAPQNVWIYYRNDGAIMQNATINFVHDALMSLNYAGWNLSNYNLGTRTLTFNMGAVAPGGTGSVYFNFTIPTTTLPGTTYSQYAEILPIAGDAMPADNQVTLPGTVVSSFDPNDKSVTPDGMITVDDSVFTYRIRFQNTGTDTAFTVAIRDTIDANLDIYSLEVLGASHYYTMDVAAPGAVVFTFNNIMLADSNINEPASHGHIIYRVKSKRNLPLGTSIRNRAAIYFDYNAPVITNTTLNTLGATSADPDLVVSASFKLFPNPATDKVSLQLGSNWEGETQVAVRDLSGRLLQSATMNPSRSRDLELDLGSLSSGLYLVECTHKGHRMVRKLVLQ
jgi:uncharacterized repeat protein (TIGR01451 family)